MNKEILSIIESLSNEKSLDKEEIFKIIETSLEVSINKKINNFNIKVKFNRKSGEFSIFKLLKIVEYVTNDKKEISFKNALKKHTNIKLNEFIEEEIKEFKFNRFISKIAKQIIFYKIKEIEKKFLVNNYKKLIGNIFLGIVKKILNTKIILNIGYEYEAILNKNHMLFNDKYILGKKIKLILYDIKYNLYGLQFFVSRSHIAMLYKLINDKIYEFNKKIFKIRYIVRNPGIRTKIVIESEYNKLNINDIYKKINNKVIEISNDLNGEKIDIILWNKNIITFIKNVIFPIKIKKIKLNSNITVFIKKDDLKNLFGINNNNIKLICKLFDKPFNINTI